MGVEIKTHDEYLSSCKIQFTEHFQIFFPWSFRIRAIRRFFSLWSYKSRVLNISNASDLCLRKRIQVYREKSSTHTKAYCFPPRLLTFVRPMRFIWISSNIQLVVVWDTCLYESLIYLPTWKLSQMVPFFKHREGSPIIAFSKTAFWTYLILTWPSRLCHNTISSRI